MQELVPQQISAVLVALLRNFFSRSCMSLHHHWHWCTFNIKLILKVKEDFIVSMQRKLPATASVNRQMFHNFCIITFNIFLTLKTASFTCNKPCGRKGEPFGEQKRSYKLWCKTTWLCMKLHGQLSCVSYVGKIYK